MIKDNETIIDWHSDDPDASLQRVRATMYGHARAGGMTLFFDSPLACRMVFDQISALGQDGQFYVNRSRFTSCIQAKTKASEALCISETSPHLMHIECVKPDVLAKVSGALKLLFNESLPKEVIAQIDKAAVHAVGVAS